MALTMVMVGAHPTIPGTLVGIILGTVGIASAGMIPGIVPIIGDILPIGTGDGTTVHGIVLVGVGITTILGTTGILLAGFPMVTVPD